jgi:hypothetical protein
VSRVDQCPARYKKANKPGNIPRICNIVRSGRLPFIIDAAQTASKAIIDKSLERKDIGIVNSAI